MQIKTLKNIGIGFLLFFGVSQLMMAISNLLALSEDARVYVVSIPLLGMLWYVLFRSCMTARKANKKCYIPLLVVMVFLGWFILAGIYLLITELIL